MISPSRRTSIIVGDMDKALRFYRDLLGMNVFYDQVVDAEATGQLLGVPGAKIRIVSLAVGGSTNGMVGLISFLSPSLAPRQEARSITTDPDVLLLFMSQDIDLVRTHAALAETGTQIVCPPTAYEVPERGTISGFTCIDPDGITVALMRFGPVEGTDGTQKITASPIRRTSLVVGDLERSRSFYESVLGMKVFYNQVIESEVEGRLLGIPGATVHVVSLQSGEAAEGMVGLLSVKSGSVNPRKAIRQAVKVPDVVLVFITDEIEAVYQRLQTWGATIQCPPVEYEIPGRGTCVGLSVYDPDGILIEFTQFGPLT
jgi:catechol 2,3-dioxygenase-like lactoylglutathione lyase family enzyme